MKEKQTVSDNANKTMLALLIFGSLSFLAALLFYFTFIPGKISPSPEKWGQFGDYIGGTLNPILAFFGLCGVYYSIRLQIEANRETQLQFLREQFENRFFQLLGLLNEPRSKIGFAAIGTDIGNKLESYNHKAFTERFSLAFKHVTTNHQLTDYLQQVHNLLRFLQRGTADGRVVDDFFQTAMARLLPSDEKVVLFYLAVHDEEFRQLAIAFPILAGLRSDRVKVTHTDVDYLDKLIPTPPQSRGPAAN